MKCEIDFMILIQDAELPAVIIGEAKAGHPAHPEQSDLLSNDDLDHLEAVQDSFRAIGIDCWICFATTRPDAAAIRGLTSCAAHANAPLPPSSISRAFCSPYFPSC